MENPEKESRRQKLSDLGLVPGSRAALEAEYGQVWDRPELFKEFQILGRLGCYVAVRRKRDGQLGNVECDHTFHLFFNFRPAT